MSDSKTLLFTSIYNEYYALIFSTAYSRLKNIEESRDVSQEVFTRFFAKMPESDNHRRWLLSALNFVILEHYKKNKTAETDIDDVIDDIKVSDFDGMRDTKIIISETLNNPELFEDTNAKTLFDLIAIYRYTFKEAGEALGITERQAKYRYKHTAHGIVDYLKMKGISGMEDLL
jgi:DNA-directed RNA polymerase specialized sigma24 family protein